MPRIAASAPLNTQSGRKRLAPKGTPYWRGIRAGLRLGWLRQEGSPAGTWVVRVAWPPGSTTQRVIGTADDGVLLADGKRVLSYDQAVDRASAFAREIEGGEAAPRMRAEQTLLEALEDYRDAKEASGQMTQAKAVSTLIKHHVPPELAARGRRALTEGDMRAWLAGLRSAKGEALSQDRVDGLRSIVRAALRRAPGAPLPALAGLTDRAMIEARGARHEAADNNIELTRAQRQDLLAAATEAVGEDAFLLFAALDATGLRPGQLARCLVSDLDVSRDGAILNAPRSFKGKPGVRKSGICSCPLPMALAERMRARAALLGQRAGDQLFTRPRLEIASGNPIAWREVGRTAWDKTTWGRAFDAAASRMAAQGRPLPDGATLYSLRHTRICRWIEAAISVTEIAQRVDTSGRMIEKHYARQLARRDYAQERLRRLQAEEGDVYG